jgi:hypothetical protein
MRGVCQVCREEKPNVNWNQYPEGTTGKPVLKEALTCPGCDEKYPNWAIWPSMKVIDASPAD